MINQVKKWGQMIWYHCTKIIYWWANLQIFRFPIIFHWCFQVFFGTSKFSIRANQLTITFETYVSASAVGIRLRKTTTSVLWVAFSADLQTGALDLTSNIRAWIIIRIFLQVNKFYFIQTVFIFIRWFIYLIIVYKKKCSFWIKLIYFV